MEDYIAQVFGDRTIASWFASFTFILIGVLISLGIGVNQRDKTTTDTPYKFNLGFFFRDNIIRVIASIFICFSIIRFGQDFTKSELALPASLGLGLVFDQLLTVAEKWQKKARAKIRNDA